MDVMEISDAPRTTPVQRPGYGIAVDGRKLRKIRESLLLDRLGLSDLARITELRQIARDNAIPGYPVLEYDEICLQLEARNIALPRHVGVSRDAIAKIENGARTHPMVHTVKAIIEALNVELARRGYETIGVDAVYAEAQDGSGTRIDDGNQDERGPGS